LYRRYMCRESPDVQNVRGLQVSTLYFLHDPFLTNLSPQRQHRKKHTKPYNCTVPGCRFEYPNLGFAQKRELDKHMKTHYPERSFRCYVEGCPSSGTLAYNMVRHLKKQHGIHVKQGEIERLCPRS
jgi:hypothetical protein